MEAPYGRANTLTRKYNQDRHNLPLGHLKPKKKTAELQL